MLTLPPNHPLLRPIRWNREDDLPIRRTAKPKPTGPHVLRLRRGDNKTWVAKILGKCPKYHIKRDFVRSEESDQHDLYRLARGEVYEVCDGNERYFIDVPHDREARPIPYADVALHFNLD